MNASRMIVTASALLLTLLTGCQTGPQGRNHPQLKSAYEAYHRGDHTAAYAAAKPLADAYNESSMEAAYLTGLCAYQLRNSAEAERYLNTAARGNNSDVAGDSLAMLGRLYAEQNRHERATAAYLSASRRLEGQDRAQALYQAGISQQSLGQWTYARGNLMLARSASRDASFIQRIDQQLKVVGWTIQVGAYSHVSNAQVAAQDLNQRPVAQYVGETRLVPATDVGGNQIILVQVGQFPSEANATAARGRVGTGAVVVPMMASR
ncbi:MAG: SPOR domain-containing protein [Phycisphaeraceae bacterium]